MLDLLVLGAGNAGQAAASLARARGLAVAIVEHGDVGGTCPLRGCVPKKVLVAATEVLDAISRAHEHGIEVGPAKLDWPKLIARERTFVEGAPASMEKALVDSGIEVVHGRARFIAENRVQVGERVIEAKKFVIATGSRPRKLSIPGAEAMVTSDDLLENPVLPRSIAFVGAGVIAFELGHVMARAGAKVTILASAAPLPKIDRACVEKLLHQTRALGIEILENVEVSAVSAGSLQHSRGTLAVERVVNSTGRVAEVEPLDLDAAGIAHDRHRIHVDGYLRSSTRPDIAIAGDALASAPQLSALATHMGKLAVENLFGEPHPFETAMIPSVVFTLPNVASVGLTEEGAKRAGHDPVVHDNDLAGWRSGRTYAESSTFSRVIVDKKTDRVLGAHLVGHGAGETIHAFAFAIARGWGARDLRDFVYAYPTFHSDVRYLLGSAG